MQVICQYCLGLPEVLGLIQHVFRPALTAGHTLDLVLGYGVTLDHLSRGEGGFSDHKSLF